MLVVFIGLWEVPDRALRLIMTASTKDGCGRVVIKILVGPLPYVAHHIHYAEWTCSLGMRINIARGKHGATLIRSRRESSVIRRAATRTATS